MMVRIASLLVWAVVLGTAVAWGLRLAGQGAPVPPHAVTVGLQPPPAAGDWQRLLGSAPPPVVAEAPAEAAPMPVDGRLRLIGVVAPRSGQATGLALISVDGKPARALGVGREVESGLRVLSVSHRRVELGPARGSVTAALELAPLPEAQRGVPGQAPAVGGLPGAMPGAMPGLPPGAMPGAMVQGQPNLVPGAITPQMAAQIAAQNGAQPLPIGDGGDAGNPMPPPMVSMPPTGTMAPPGMMPPVTNPRGAQQR